MIPLTHGLILAAILFVLGLTGLVIRRNLLFMLIGLEIMINASALAFVVADFVNRYNSRVIQQCNCLSLILEPSQFGGVREKAGF